MGPRKLERILVIEDDPDMAKVLVFGLRRHFGAEVVIVPDGVEGARRARAEAFDLIVLDVMLPSADGFEVLKLLKRQDPVVEAPVVFVTGASGKVFDLKNLQSLGAIGVVRKPFASAELCARIDELLRDGEVADG